MMMMTSMVSVAELDHGQVDKSTSQVDILENLIETFHV